MASYDLGDVVPLGIAITDASGVAANATTVVLTITAPDGTTTTPSVTNSSTGNYDATFTPTQAGRHRINWLATGTNASAWADEFTVRDNTRHPVISWSDALAHLNIPANAAPEDELRRFMDAAEDLAEQYVGTILGRATFTETHDGGYDHIRLRKPCALSVASVYENGVLVDPSNYYIDPSGQRLYRRGSGSFGYSLSSMWAAGVQSVVVTYTSGYLVTPPAVQQGVLEILRHLWQTQRGAVNVMNRTGSGDDFYTASTYSLPRRAMELLDQASLPGMI
jgi:hypothetical protein